MSVEIKIPAVGESITSGVIAEWHKKNGGTVAKGDILLTLETDKVSSEVPAEEAGVLEIIVSEGEEVDIGAVVGRIREGEGVPAGPAKTEPDPASVEEEPVPHQAPAPSPAVAEPEPSLSVVPGSKPAEKAVVPVEDPASGRFTRKKMSPLRRKIASHLVSAQQNAAILTTFNECDMSAVMGLRKEIQESFIEKHGIKLGFMSFFIKAVVQGLKDVPNVNGRIDEGDIILNHYYDVGVAVGTEKGLIVPVVRDADQKSFAEIEKEIIRYATLARDGKIQISDLQGGVFTISNGGVYGSLLSTPILNPPQSGILGMHTIQQRPVAVDGKVEIRPMMYLALSYDHRIVDGKEAVTFLIRVKEYIEQPVRLMLGA